jgi:hypothetical protein
MWHVEKLFPEVNCDGTGQVDKHFIWSKLWRDVTGREVSAVKLTVMRSFSEVKGDE